jgi:Tfp pilus assembly protein PilO
VIVGLAGAVVVSLLWFFLLWSPQGKRLDAADAQKASAEQTNSQLQVTLDRLRDLERRRPELKDQLTQLRRAVPDSPQLARLLLTANDAADASGVELTTVTPAKPAADTAAAAATTATTAPASGTTGGGGTTTTTAATGSAATTPTTTAAAAAPSSINIQMEVKGGYFQILDFVNRVNDFPRIVVIDSFDIGEGQGSGSTTGGAASATTGTDLTGTLTARTFTGAAPAATASGTTAGATTATTAAPSTSNQTGKDS